jgi:DNA ligase-1
MARQEVRDKELADRDRPMLAHKYADQDVVGWFMSEKLDGVRAVWNGKELISRHGNVFHAPDWFVEGLPENVVLDGELSSGRGLLQQTTGTVRSNDGDWGNIRFMVFDVINSADCESRQKTLGGIVLPGHCEVIEQIKCNSTEHLLEFKEFILSLGGEGVMLKRPKSLYRHTRSRDLLKVKDVARDEAVVLRHTKGKGAYEGMLGALICEYKGIEFRIGSGLSEVIRSNPPEIGSTVTFSLIGTTGRGVPRHAAFVGVRDYE